MAASSPDSVRHSLALRASAVGLALGVVVFAAGAAVLYEAQGLLAATTGMFVTGAIALGAGLWAGTPSDESESGHGSPVAPRWLGAALATGLAGAFAVWLAGTAASRGMPAVRVASLLLMVAFPLYRMGLLFPVLLAWAAGEEEDESSAAPLAALIGGTLNGMVLGATLAGLVLMPRVTPGALLFGAAVLLAVPLIFPEQRRTGSQERPVYEAATPFGTIRVVDTVFPGQRQPERALYLGEEIESGEMVRSGAPTFGYIAAAERWLAEVTAPGDSYLFLGGGAYTLPRRVAERDPSARITVVELNPEVTRVARRFFGLRPEHGIASVHGDARAVAEELPARAWNRIFVDVYDGQEALPYPLVTREGFAVLERLLRPGGTLLVNVIGEAVGEGAPRFWSVVRTLAESFPSVAVYPHFGPDVSGRQNFLLAATSETGHSFPQRAGLFDLFPRHGWPGGEGTIVFRDRFPAADDLQSAPARDPASGAYDPSAVAR